jgi:hypothetical protein
MTKANPAAAQPVSDAARKTRGAVVPLTKLTVNITPRATAALEEASRTNGETKTNVVNRAIQAYAFLTRMMASGWELVLKDPKEGREQQVQFF